MQKPLNLLITGPLGHIGSKFIHGLNSTYNYGKVLLIDNFSTLRYPSLFNLPSDVKFKFIEGDILTYNFEDVLKDIDIVLHLAAITDAANSFEIEDKVMKINFEGTKRVAEACAKTNTKFILISTTSVYGTQKEVVYENCPEDDLKPQSPYANSKLLAENSLARLSDIYDSFHYVICRFGTIYGTSVGMRFHTAINKFIWQAIMDQPISVWATALHQRRPYLSLKEAINALHFIIDNDIFNNQIYNVLSINVTVNDIIEEIKLYMPGVRTNFVDAKIMNQLSYTVSNKKFSDLGFKFDGKLNEISETIELLRNANRSSQF